MRRWTVFAWPKRWRGDEPPLAGALSGMGRPIGRKCGAKRRISRRANIYFAQGQKRKGPLQDFFCVEGPIQIPDRSWSDIFKRRAYMDQLDEFLTLLSGSFDNAQQFEEMRRKGDLQFPFAQHINTVCNSKIRNLPGKL